MRNPLELMKTSIKQLESMREITTKLDILERDVKIMKWISTQPRFAEKLAKEFYEIRMSDPEKPIDRLETIKRMGLPWEQIIK